MSANAKPTAPHLIKDSVELARWLELSQTGTAWNHDGRQLSLEEWLAQGDDCTESHYAQAASLGVPLARLADLPPDSAATALITPRWHAACAPCRCWCARATWPWPWRTRAMPRP